MKLFCWLNLVLFALSAGMSGQAEPGTFGSAMPQYNLPATQDVPRLVKFSGNLYNVHGSPMSGTTGVRFSIYKDEAGEFPLWTESQNLTLDARGHFIVFLGSASSHGVPSDVVASGEARWIGMTTTDDGIDHPRFLLSSVPYALEAADAQTLGGRRAEEFLTVTQFHSEMQHTNIKWPCSSQRVAHAEPPCSPETTTNLMGGAIQDTSFEALTGVGPSFISDATTGPPFLVKSAELVPNLNADLLHGLSIQDLAQTGATNLFSPIQLFNQGMSLEGPPPTGTAPQTSPPLDFKARVFDTASNAFTDRRFRWQAEPANATQGTADRFSLLFGAGTPSPTETGFSVNSDGTINFASNQQFPTSAILPPTVSSPLSNSSTFQWNQAITSTPIVVGTNTISLSQCPPGVNASDPTLYVYISGAGAPEAVHVTGGTCKGDGKSGTLQFTATNAYPAGYTISSASSGIQEAIIAANTTTHSGNIVVPAGEYAVYAPITIRMTDVTIDFSGAIVDCYVQASCIFIGDPANPGISNDVTLIKPRGRPMVPYGTNAFIEDNGQKTQLLNVSTAASAQANSFGTYIQVDDDQSFLLDGLDSTFQGVRCDTNFCGAYVTAPGPFGVWPAVGWIKNAVFSLQCDGSAVDWQSGNGLQITDSVIQGWSLFGIRVGHRRGGFGGFISDNVYYEASPSCEPYNPYGNVGLAGIINQGGEVNIKGVAMNGVGGVFPNWGATSGSQQWLYWVVPVHATYGDGIPLPAGYAWTNGPTSITGTFPRVAGASSYKILKIVTDGTKAPYPEGTGNYLLTTVQQSACAAHTCQFTDNGQTLTSYSNSGENFYANMYMPELDFWPGAIIMSRAGDESSANGGILTPQLTADILGEGAVVSTLPANIITGQAQTMIPAGGVPAAAGISAMNTGSTLLPGATLFKAFNSAFVVPSNGFKGRLNLGNQGTTGGFYPLITMSDSNWGKTWATPNERPTADVGDIDVGYEGTINTYYERAASEIRHYIGKFPDGKPQESITAATKTFNVPVVINGDLTVTGTCTGCGSSIKQASLPTQIAPEFAEPKMTSLVLSEGSTTEELAHSAAVSRVSLAREIPLSTLCAASTCKVGMYQVTYYLDSGSSCRLPGNAGMTLTLHWRDDAGNRSLQVPLTGSGGSNVDHLSLGKAPSFGGGQISLWTTGSTPISYSTSYVSCASGQAKYSLRLAVRSAQ